MQNPIRFGPFTILNPNTSGQGQCNFSHSFLEILVNSGYKYSHSTIVRGNSEMCIPDMIYHSFFKGENDKITGNRRAISISHYQDGKEANKFDSSILGRGRTHYGFGRDNLNSHLKYLERKVREGIRKSQGKSNKYPEERECCFLIIPGRGDKRGSTHRFDGVSDK